MKKGLTIKDFVKKVYQNLIEENIKTLLGSEEIVSKTDSSPEEKLRLKRKIRNVSGEIAEEFAEEIIKEGFPSKEIHSNRVRGILKEIINKKISKLKDEE